MRKTYYVHTIFGERLDGTKYATDTVEFLSGEDDQLRPIPDEVKEFYTIKHRYHFAGSKEACESEAKYNNNRRKEDGYYGSAKGGLEKIGKKVYSVEYDFERGLKTVFYGGGVSGGIIFGLDDGKEIDDFGEDYKKAQELVDEHWRIISHEFNVKMEPKLI